MTSRRTVVAWFAAIAALTLTLGAAQDPPAPKPFRVSVDYTLVQATVLDQRDQPVTSLDANDFLVTQGGSPQRIVHFQPPSAPWAIALIVDTSVSTSGQMALIRQASGTFLDHLPAGTQVAVIETGCETRVHEGLTADKARLRGAIGALGAVLNQCTRINDAIALAIEDVLGSVHGRRAVVVLSDGVDTGSRIDSLRLEALAGLTPTSIFPLLIETLKDQETTLQAQADLRFQTLVELMLVARTDAGKEKVREAAIFLIEQAPSECSFLLLGPGKSSAVQWHGWTANRDELQRRIHELKFKEKGPKYNAPMDRPAPVVNSILIAENQAEALSAGLFGQLGTLVTVLDQPDAKWQSDLAGFLLGINAADSRDRALAKERQKHLQAREQMTRLASRTGGMLVPVVRLEDLEVVYARVARDLRTAYTIGFQSSAPEAEVVVGLKDSSRTERVHVQRSVGIIK